MKTATPPEKSHPPLPQQPPSKGWGPVKHPLFENLVGGSTPYHPPPPAENGKGGSHYGHLPASLDLWQLYQLMLFRSFWICPIGFFQIDFDDLPTTLLMKAPNVMLNTEIQTLKVIRGMHQKSFVSWFQMIQNTFSGINNKTQLYC